MSEEKFVRITCVSLRVLAWILLIFGIISSFVASTALSTALLLNPWSGVAVLVFFILVFLLINLITKIAEITLKIKTKVGA